MGYPLSLAKDLIATLRGGGWLVYERLKLYPRLLPIGYALAAVLYLALSENMIDPGSKPVGSDFVNVYAAGEMARAGAAADAYDWAKHRQAERALFPAREIPYFGWHYPPLFLLIATPLAFLPYALALAFYQAATLAGYAGVMWRILKPDRDGLIVALAFPAVFICLLHGQNGLLTAALLGSGLLLLDKRPWLAGAALGALVYKPQFAALALLVPLTTLRWRVTLSAAATVAVLTTATIAIFGAETWNAFLASETLTRRIVLEQGATGWHKIQSVFAAVRLFGGSIAFAYLLQFAAAALAVSATVWAWRNKIPIALQCAILCLATPLVTPYVMDYDFAFLALPIAWLALQGRATGFMPWEKSVLFLLWLMPLISRSVAEMAQISLGPLSVGLALAFAVLRARNFLILRKLPH